MLTAADRGSRGSGRGALIRKLEARKGSPTTQAHALSFITRTKRTIHPLQERQHQPPLAPNSLSLSQEPCGEMTAVYHNHSTRAGRERMTTMIYCSRVVFERGLPLPSPSEPGAACPLLEKASLPPPPCRSSDMSPPPTAPPPPGPAGPPLAKSIPVLAGVPPYLMLPAEQRYFLGFQTLWCFSR